MAVSLHGLRGKIAGAAVLKGAVRRAGSLTPVAKAISTVADAVEPGTVAAGQAEASGSYRGLLAGMLREALPAPPVDHTDVIFDAVCGLIPGPRTEHVSYQQLLDRAEAQPTAGNLLAAAAEARRPYNADLTRALQLYEAAFEKNPHDLRAYEGILSTTGRTDLDWQRVWEAASVLKPRRGLLGADSLFWVPINQLFQPQPPAEALRRAKPLLEQYRPRVTRLHQLLIETITARLQFLGEFRAAQSLRAAMAENRVRELRGIPLESPLWLKHLLGAYAHLDQDARLLRTAARPLVDTGTARAGIAAEKLRADAALYTGDASHLIAHAARRREQLTLPGEELMHQLVHGKRIAVVGPAAASDALGEAIEDYDIVVRTQYKPQTLRGRAAKVGERTDIAYFQTKDLTSDWDQLAETIPASGVKLAVARPLMHTVLSAEERQAPDWLRFARFEYGLYFRGAPLGIQRILYDLLQFAPAEVGLFHADFYAGTGTFTAGYRHQENTFGPHSALNDLVMMHDLGYEFRFVQRLLRAGTITAHGTAAEVLGLSEDEYLGRLESGPLAALSPSRALRQ
ncbi:hypothetical protein [Nesterenkonia sp. NBAIMH1]|uniref:hypothetical protein n=1 Tax=Nesterenkonia sp. NBAIMH1 TaxID=2600320 RepID=UPI0011B77CF4|nr:hypothetical protein [Nesterenkonia sp. NBAIMH1]